MKTVKEGAMPTKTRTIEDVDEDIAKLLAERMDKRVDGFDYAKLTTQIDNLLDERLERTK